MESIANTARVKKYPGYFAGQQRYISRLPVTRRLSLIGECAQKIQGGDHRPVSEIVRLVIGSDFRPEILAAAKEAMSPIPGIVIARIFPLAQFNMTDFNVMHRAFYLGALFECLPAKVSQPIFEDFYFYRQPNLASMYQAGHSLLRLSSAESANEFALGLHRIRPEETERQMRWTANNGVIRNWLLRRYESAELANLFFSAIGDPIQPNPPLNPSIPSS